MSNIRSLTRREQLEWYIKYLLEEKQEIEEEIEDAEEELRLVKKRDE